MRTREPDPVPRRAIPRRTLRDMLPHPNRYTLLAAGMVLLLAATLGTVGGLVAAESDRPPPTPDWRGVATTVKPRPSQPTHVDRHGTRTPLPVPSMSDPPRSTPSPQALSRVTFRPTRTPAPSRTATTRRTVTPKPAPKSTTKPSIKQQPDTGPVAMAKPAATTTAPKPAATTKPPARSCPTLQGGGTARAHTLHRALCANFPQVRAYGGTRPGDSGYHGSGRAVDAMVSDYATGQAIAEWARANAAEYGITEVIWRKRIWTTQRASEGWRAMGDRGSITANHGDHVHLSVR